MCNTIKTSSKLLVPETATKHFTFWAAVKKLKCNKYGAQHQHYLINRRYHL